jgi:phage terminase small subunit
MTNPALAAFEDVKGLGPDMVALNPRQRRYVIALSEGMNGAAAARAAGYGTPTSSAKSIGNIAHQLNNDPKVQAAVAEFSKAILRAAGPSIATRAVLKIAGDDAHNDQLKAAKLLLDRFDPVEQRTHSTVDVNVKIDNHQLDLQNVEALLDKPGGRQLLESTYGEGLWRIENEVRAKRQALLPPPMDGEFTEVKPAEEEDW